LDDEDERDDGQLDKLVSCELRGEFGEDWYSISNATRYAWWVQMAYSDMV